MQYYSQIEHLSRDHRQFLEAALSFADRANALGVDLLSSRAAEELAGFSVLAPFLSRTRDALHWRLLRLQRIEDEREALGRALAAVM